MRSIEPRELAADSAPMRVARGSDLPPEFVLVDPERSRFVAAGWRRRRSRLDAPNGIDRHLLSYCGRGGGASVIHIDGRRHRVREHTGGVTFIPAGHPVAWTFDSPAEVMHLHLYVLPDGLIEREAYGVRHDGGAPTPPRLRPFYDVRDAWMDSFFRLLVAEHEASRSASGLHMLDLLERLGPLLARRLYALQDPVCQPRRAGAIAPLQPALLRRVETFIEEHLAERITVSTLAALVELSADHFARAFTQATGSTPHRWILERRLDAARDRLAEGRQGLACIARDCGLAGPSHLSSSFRRRFGVTPSDFRRGACRRG